MPDFTALPVLKNASYEKLLIQRNFKLFYLKLGGVAMIHALINFTQKYCKITGFQNWKCCKIGHFLVLIKVYAS
jgi:hypothetical protein